MYDFEHPALKSYLNRFPARQYTLKSDEKQFFLRFAACFGQFLCAHDMVITYKNLPFKIYELTHYSFRREQSGELAGLKRLRAFSMPDMHTLCQDLEQSKQEFQSQFDLCKKWNDELGISFETAFRAQTDFFKENKQWYVSMIKKIGKPTLLELFEERYAYFITKFEMNFIDNAEKASGLSTVQIDVENSERFEVKYIDDKGEKQTGPILHASIPGAIERVVYALLEREAMNMKQGKKAMFPVWLSPTQLRIIPIGEKQKDYAVELTEKLAQRSMRVDCEDRDDTLGKKIREAEKEWIPYIAVIGDKEIESGKLNITMRATGEKKQLSSDEIAEIIEKDNAGKPFEKLSLPRMMSRRAGM
jgi:threonyl-tRNA synthetase